MDVRHAGAVLVSSSAAGNGVLGQKPQWWFKSQISGLFSHLGGIMSERGSPAPVLYEILTCKYMDI